MKKITHLRNPFKSIIYLTVLFCFTFFQTSHANNFELSYDDCSVNAGTLTAIDSNLCFDGKAKIGAKSNKDMVVPKGYTVLYVLTQGESLTIVNVSATPDFIIEEGGNYTIHTFVYPSDFDPLTVVTLGETTGFDVNSLLIQGGGDLCASLDVAGASITVSDPDAGTLTADSELVTISGGSATISATPNGDINVPDGFSSLYVLTQGESLTIVNAGGEPSFEVTESGNYTIHTFVYPSDFDPLSVVTIGVTTGVDVLGLITEGGGDLCASLDVAGAPIKVEEEPCLADAGTLTAIDSNLCFDGKAKIGAKSNKDMVVPKGYTVLYVLTQGESLTIVNVSATPDFIIEEGGNYTIHTFVYPSDFDPLTVVTLGETTGFDVNSLLIQGGGDLCASLDVAGASITVSDPDAGTLTADSELVTISGGSATISATPNGDINVPDGFSSLYVLTQGESLTIVNAGGEPSFEVTESGNYTIHTFVYPSDFDPLSVVTIGVTTGVDVLGLITEGGGDLCASLDVAGAPIKVEEGPCLADAGTLKASDTNLCLDDINGTKISATPSGDTVVPEGYTVLYVLTQGESLTIVNVSATPDFTVEEGGNYTIHTFVYPSDFDPLTVVTLGETTGFDVNSLLIQGGGDLCASLDVAGASITVSDPDAGTLTADSELVTISGGSATISATPNGDINVPDGFSSLYVLTQGESLTIVNAGGEPSFEVTESGNYTIHTFVYPSDFDPLSVVTIGVTTGVDVLGLITEGGGDLCASLDVAGAPIKVEEGPCLADAGTMYSESPISCLMYGSATISASQNNPTTIPQGYEQLFVLTNAFSLKIINVSSTPEFEVSHKGFYRIHSLVYNPDTLDLSVVVLGETTGFDVLDIINSNNICASLDVHGALNLVINYNWFCNFFNNYHYASESKSLDTYVAENKDFEVFENKFIEENTELSIYPNPVLSNLNVKIKLFDDEVMTYSIKDLNGRVIMTGNLKSNIVDAINLSNFSNGMYLINLQSDYRNISRKVIVNK